ncbi:MAG TPA: glucose-1-phosphate adenylyltransferase [Actinomycetota bacterium]|nr:glucose-1-phosphate adenylyltransferase [Actinomycetota bacterium]
MGRPHVFGIVLAGGEGKRLMPLTRDRAKPAVPFGGHYRLIDFALSNLVNAGYLKIAVLTQYKSHSLDRHVTTTWRLSPLLGNYVTPVPAQMRRGPHWYQGSADAIYQSLNLIGDERPDFVCVFGADHIYRMDPSQMLRQHIESGAEATVAAVRAPRSQASEFGVIEALEGTTRIGAFLEKPTDAEGLPDAPDEVFASMGNYIFTASTLVDAVKTDAADAASKHDMGGSIIPMLVDEGRAHVYDFSTNTVPGVTDRDHAYWRDVGTLDAYYESHLDLVSPHPIFNLYNMEWPILTWIHALPPAKFVHDAEGRVGRAIESLISPGVIISGAEVRRSILSPGVRVHSFAQVEGSVLMHGVEIGRNAVVRNAIIDKNVVVPEGAEIGVDLDIDRSRFTVSAGGVVAIGKGEKVE